MKHTTSPATTSRAARAASIAGRFAVFTIAAAAAVFAAIALTGSKASADGHLCAFPDWSSEDTYNGDVTYEQNSRIDIKVGFGEAVNITLPPAIIEDPIRRYFIGSWTGPFRYGDWYPTDPPEGLEFDPNTRQLSPVREGGLEKGFETNVEFWYVAEAELEEGNHLCRWYIQLLRIRVAPLEFVNFPSAYSYINARKDQPIADIVFPPASYGREPISYKIDPLPAGLEFNPDTRRLSGTPTGISLGGEVYDVFGGTQRFSYQAEDVSGGRDVQSITLRLNNPVPPRLRPAETTPELGTLDRNIIRRGAWIGAHTSDVFRGQSLDPTEEIYTFQLSEPTELTIDLASDDADASLEIDGRRNDDGGAGTDAKLIVNLDAGSYQLKVSGTSEQAIESGYYYYTLRISSPDFAPIVQTVPSAGRIVARRLDDARIEFAWHVEGGDRVLPRNRYLPARPPTGRWLNSSDILVEGVSIGKINVRVHAGTGHGEFAADTGRVEFAFTPAGGERILPQSRYFPASAAVNRWLRSTRIEWIE